jgi:acyl-CoA synthetase (AMP-forming)/AMP-acid ligase II
MYITSAVRRAAQVNAGGIATIDGRRMRTWAELASRVARLAGALRQLGVGDGDRVAMLSWNSDRYLEFYFAVPWAGAVIVPLNPRWSTPELEFAAEDAGARVLLASLDFQAQAGQLRERLGVTLINTSDAATPPGWLDYESLVESGPAIAAAERDPQAPYAMFYTGGTTGRSKAVLLSSANLHANAMVVLHGFGMDATTTYLHAPTLSHLADGTYAFAVTIAAGTHAVVPGFEPGTFLRACERHGVTHLMLLPTLLKMVLDHPDFERTDLSAVRWLIYGATPIADAVLRDAMQRLPQLRFVQAYGQTELSPIATILEPPFHVLEGAQADKRRSCGRAAPGVCVEVVDPNGNEQPRGTIGEIRARGPNVMLGYWNRPQETAAAIRDGWVWTGDLGYMDADGFLYVVDRVKDMIKTGGENVYSVEVEDALMRYPGIAACAVFAVPDDKWGEAVHAVVVPAQGASVDVETLSQHCRGLISAYKVPKRIEIRSTLPLSAAGKVLKRELRDPYWAAVGRQVN